MTSGLEYSEVTKPTLDIVNTSGPRRPKVMRHIGELVEQLCEAYPDIPMPITLSLSEGLLGSRVRSTISVEEYQTLCRINRPLADC